MSNWFEVDKDGLARILKRRGLEFIAFELISNAWDSSANKVTVTLEPVTKKLARFIVEDNDPNGFTNIAHAYTMFADSSRRGDLNTRGRFNLGEKLALAVAEEATIVTTTAAFRFDKSGRYALPDRRKQGSRVELLFPATGKEIAAILEAIGHLVPPVPTTVNGTLLSSPEMRTVTVAQLETVLPDEEGNLKHYWRKAQVEIFQNSAGKVYEMGIPVVETGDKFCYNVLQKVPLNMERDNVTPSYLRQLRVAIFNETHSELGVEDCNTAWVREALGDKRASPEAVRSAVKARFGNKVVAFDPSDREANNIAVSKGYIVVNGNQLSSAEWENIRNARAILPAGKVCPSPKAIFSADGVKNDVPQEKWTPGMQQVVDYAHRLAGALLGCEISVRIICDIAEPYQACYGQHELVINKGKVGKAWFEQGISDEVVALLIHEFGHEYESNHLSANYNDVLCNLGAKMRRLGSLDTEGKVV